MTTASTSGRDKGDIREGRYEPQECCGEGDHFGQDLFGVVKDGSTQSASNQKTSTRSS